MAFRLIGYRRTAVYVRVKNNSQIRTGFLHPGADGRHSLRVFRIRHVIREVAVRLQELAGRNIRSQRCQNFLRKKSAGTVSRIHGDFHAIQLSAHFAGDDGAQVRRIHIHQFVFLALVMLRNRVNGGRPL